MKTIKLYGHLGKQFGKIHKYYVDSPAEAIQLLKANYKGFEAAVRNFQGAGYRVITGKEDIESTDLYNPTGAETIKIIPVISGEGGLGKIVLGVTLMFAAPYLAPMLMEGAIAMGATGATAGIGVFAEAAMYVGSAVGSLGMSMVLGGISQLLYSPPTSASAAKQAQSGAFDGARNTTRQGAPIAVGYGKLMVGSAVISAGLSSVSVPV